MSKKIAYKHGERKTEKTLGRYVTDFWKGGSYKGPKMNPESVINYKVYLCAAGFEPEIRRITVDKDICRNYFYLKQKLITIFPALKEAQFTISWKDREGDTVRICTDEELSIALNEMESQDFKKIYVSSSPQHENEGPVHPNVVCDGCESSIQGFRYKCVVCPNFDLCPDCERSQIHPDHPMIRIPLPMSIEEQFSRRFFHKISKQFDGLSHASERWEKKGRGDGPRESGKRRSHRSCPVSAAATSAAAAAASAVADPISQLIGAFIPTGYYGEASTSTPNAQGETPVDSSNQQTGKTREQFCSEVLQNLASLLDPLGVNVFGNSGGTSQSANEDIDSTSGEPSQGQEYRQQKTAQPSQQQPAQPSQQQPAQPSQQQPAQPSQQQPTQPSQQQPTQPSQQQPAQPSQQQPAQPSQQQPVQLPQQLITQLSQQPLFQTSQHQLAQNFHQEQTPISQPEQLTQASKPLVYFPVSVEATPTIIPQQDAQESIQALQTQQPAVSSPPVQQPVTQQPVLVPQTHFPMHQSQQPIQPRQPEPSACLKLRGGIPLAYQKDKVEKENSPVLDETWTVIRQNEGAEAAATSAVPATATPPSAPTENIYPAIPVMPITESGENSIDKTMERLIEMGFVEEEGWLRQLVENKKGNIAEVLRFLMPLPKPSSDPN